MEPAEFKRIGVVLFGSIWVNLHRNPDTLVGFSALYLSDTKWAGEKAPLTKPAIYIATRAIVGVIYLVLIRAIMTEPITRLKHHVDIMTYSGCAWSD